MMKFYDARSTFDFLRIFFWTLKHYVNITKKLLCQQLLGAARRRLWGGDCITRRQKPIDSINSPSRGAWWKPISSQRVMQSFFGDLLLYRSIAHLALSPNSLAGSSPSGIELLSVAARYWIKLCDRTSTTPTSPHKSKHFAGDSNLPIFTRYKGDPVTCKWGFCIKQGTKYDTH